MSDIPLSKPGRPVLQTLRNPTSTANSAPERTPAPSTGSTETAANPVTASSLNSRAGDLNTLMDSMASGIKTIEQADSGLASITKNLEAMQALLRNASIIDHSALATSYNGLLGQLDVLVEGADVDGVNLLRGDNLNIAFNDTGTASIDVQTKGGASISSASLGLGGALSADDIGDAAKIAAKLDAISKALDAVHAQSTAFGSNLTMVQSRSDFTRSMIDTLQAGAAKLSLADSNEEAANILALQTRQSLAALTISVASQSDQGVLALLR